MTTDTQTGPITLADVRAALADTDPARTNASKLREILGRGSFATVQKHLDAIRLERTPALPAAPGAIPPAPADAIAAIWSAAWAQAQVAVLERLERLSAERDAAQAQVAAQAQDVAGLAGEIDAQAAAAQALADTQALALAAAQAVALDATARADAADKALAGARAEIERITAAAAQAQALAEREFQIERQTLQAALERQIERYGELKNMVDKIKPLAK